MQHTIDNALRVIAEKGAEATIGCVLLDTFFKPRSISYKKCCFCCILYHNSHLNLCGSSVSQEAVKEVLQHCPQLNSINLSSCRGLPRGVKRLMQGTAELNDLREALGVPVPAQASPVLPSNNQPSVDHESSTSNNTNASSANATVNVAAMTSSPTTSRMAEIV